MTEVIGHAQDNKEYQDHGTIGQKYNLIMYKKQKKKKKGRKDRKNKETVLGKFQAS